ncbi:MAG: alpha/beta hydrolase, partial [Nocardioides sp.]
WFGAAWTWASSPCAGWPRSTKADRFTGPYDVTTASPVLVVGNTYDPATPLHGARAVNRMLDGSRLLVLDGWGHGALDSGPCIRQAYADYLVDGTLPPAGTVCKPRQELFPRHHR